MKSAIQFIVLISVLSGCSISDKDWKNLGDQLEAIKKEDLRYRSKMDSVGKVEGWQSKTIEQLWEKQRILDSTNLKQLDKLIDKFGYPSKARVGDLSYVPFQVLQHADDSTMATYYDLIIGAGKNGDLPMREVAQFQDRVLVARKQPQDYGTQISIDFKQHPKTGMKYDSMYLWEVRDIANVNERRIKAGLDSLEAQLKRYGIDPSKRYLIRGSPPQ
jgi:hypothetical protein